MIVDLCADRYLTRQQLAQLLGRRSVAKLYENYLSPLLKTGLLELRFPDAPSHPEQAYRSRKEPA